LSVETHATESTARGRNAFDPAALRADLAAAEAGQRLTAEQVAEYRRFYGLEFADVSHRHEMFCISGADERLVVQYFVPDQVRSHVLMCHGYYDHVGLFRYTIEYLLKRGVAVVTYDQIGHGLSSGASATIESFDRYVAATRAVFLYADAQLQPATAWHWVAQSMGGAIVMEYLEQHPPVAEGREIGEIVLLAPLVRPYAWWINRWVFEIAKRMITERPRSLSNNAENPEFQALQKVDPLQARALPVAWVQAMFDWSRRFVDYPVSQLAPKLLQGDSDKTVDWQYTIQLYEHRYPNCRHLIIPGGRHHLANESEQIRAQMWSFLDEHCSW